MPFLVQTGDDSQIMRREATQNVNKDFLATYYALQLPFDQFDGSHLPHLRKAERASVGDRALAFLGALHVVRQFLEIGGFGQERYSTCTLRYRQVILLLEEISLLCPNG